ncbi:MULTISPECIES: endonuclease [unclassified Flavobacterium]|uniref:endonuclease n=1 Tax=unclassified Flavobacterium TaxID=196869 RepID=UPI0013D184B0|nr:MULTISPECIES: endonuclease [unclassified Flavobacterium]MBA5792499.1 endonuclease [Flavobacterium sp. xlx-221]
MRKNIFLLFSFIVSITVFGQTIPSYYSTVDFTLSGVPLKNQLATLITNTHTNTLTYAEIWNALKIVDQDPTNSNNVVLVYGWPNTTTGQHAITRSKNDNGGNAGEWNREHVYAKSLGTPSLGETGPGADAHHLRASDVQWNNNRGNKKFAAGSGNSGNVGSDWYPGDEWKGDVARMMMYMYVRYGTRCLPANVGVGSTTNSPDGMIDLFLQWNVDDPVSTIEIQRNNYLGGTGTYAQGNRNPFIDNPYLATKIWGGAPAPDNWGILGNKEFNLVQFKLYPNPAPNNTISIETKERIDLITVYNLEGKLVHKVSKPQFNNGTYTINQLKSGSYILTIKSGKNSSTKKFIVK